MITRENIKGKMIVFEGTDGSFKETNSKRLTEYIKNNYNENTVLISYPQYDSESSVFVKRYLSGIYGEVYDVNAYAATTFYALDRYHNKKTIDCMLSKGYTVILDRYTGSNIFHQSVKFDTNEKMDKFIDWCIDLEYNIFGLHKEDITIFMYKPSNINTIKDRDSKNGITNDIHESNNGYQYKLDKNHGYICNKLSWNIVNCYEEKDNSMALRDKELIFNNILKVLNDKFN